MTWERVPIEQRLLRHTEVDEDGCWIWTKALDRHGYGKFVIARDGDWRNGRQTVRPHRLAYELFVGPIPDGMTIDHLCRRRACCNPDHLKPVVNRENIMRGIGPPARNAQKLTCKYGHLLEGANVYIYTYFGREWRCCRECRRRLSREYQRRRRARAKQEPL